MLAKPASRSELIDRVLLLDEMAARALIRNFPVVIQSLSDLVAMVTPEKPPTPELFDVCCDAWTDSHPTKEPV